MLKRTKRKILGEADQLLVDVRDLLIERGWVQDAYVNEDGYCTVGAIGEVAVVRPLDERGLKRTATAKALNALLTTLKLPSIPEHPSNEDVLRSFVNIENWNDVIGRTKDEVVATINDARGLIQKELELV